MTLLILPVVIPLLAAPIIVMVGHGLWAWRLALLASLLGLAATVNLFLLGDGYSALGGWEPPVGINFVVDGASRPLLLLLMVAAVLSLWALPPERLTGLHGPRSGFFYALFCLCLAGLAGMAGTGDAFNLFVFLEISSLATYALVAAGPRRGALHAAFQYLVLGTVGGSFVLLGVGLLYQATGSLNMADIADRLPGNPMAGAVLAGGAFLLLGLGLKTAMFPLHAWLPGVYAQSPTPFAAFLAATATKISLYALARLAFGVFGLAWLTRHHVGEALLLLAAAGMLFGSVAALRQSRLKLLLAWSSVAQIGYLLLGLALLTPAGITAAWLQLLIHAFVKGGLFLAAARLADDRLGGLRGLGRRDPLTAVCLTVGALSLLGTPLTAGFIGKWWLLSASLDAGSGLAVAALALSSALAVVYVARIVLPLWQDGDGPELVAGPRLPMLLTALASLVFGLWPAPLIELGRGAAGALLP